MKKLLLISMLIGAMPVAMMAQDDDLYFVPKKNKSKVEQVTDKIDLPAETYSNHSDVIEFSATKGVFPDSAATEDFELTKKMVRFEDYDLSDNAAYWAGYRDGRDTWGWHSPWYYGRYGYYGYYGHYGYYGYYPWYDAWYDPWYDPWYFGPYYSYYGWGYPHYYGWGGYYGWYSPWYYPYYYGGGGGITHYYSRTGNAGTINRWGGTNGASAYRGYNRVTANGSRMGSLRERAGYSGAYSSGNSQRSRSGNFSGSRSNTYSNSSYSGTRSSGSFGGSTGGSRGGGFSGGGGGGGRSGGGSLGGRR